MNRHLRSTTFLAAAIFFAASISSCKTGKTNNLATEIESITRFWVPDTREGICIALLDTTKNGLVLRGETNLPEAAKAIREFLNARNIIFSDSLMLLPDTSIIRKPYGLVNVSVSNMRFRPSHDEEMVSQSLMGTPVKILKQSRGWFLVQTPDSYIGWTEAESLVMLSETEYMKWKSSPRVIFLEKTGDVLSVAGRDKVVSDIVAGCILVSRGRVQDNIQVILPDGREGFLIEKSCRDFNEWAGTGRPEEEKIVSDAMKFMGIPYLWGGTSSKGMDCSGFTKTVFYLNGMILARDVSLQYMHVKHLTPKAYPDSLRKGDLLFFGSYRNSKPRPTHVGIYTGNTEFIHASGMIRINSLDSTRPNFSRYRRNSFLGAGRIIGLEPGPGRQLVGKHNWYY